jgi:hypothetical protein
VSERLVAGALGAPARLSSALLGAGDSVVCSWASLPGSVTATVLTGRRPRVAAERALRGDEGAAVAVLPGARGWSGSDRPGDLVVLVGDNTVLRLDVVPVAGWADDDVPTTRAEIALARDLVRRIS